MIRRVPLASMSGSKRGRFHFSASRDADVRREEDCRGIALMVRRRAGVFECEDLASRLRAAK